MQGIVFYPLLCIFCCSFLAFGEKYPVSRKNILLIIPFIVLVFLFGFSYPYLGLDKPTYIYMYTRQYGLEGIEPFFRILNKFFYTLRMPHQVMMSVYYALQYIFLYLAFKKTKTNFAFGILTFFIIYLFVFNDGLRQSVSLLVVFLSYESLYKKDYGKFLLISIIAFMFHKSAILVIISFLFSFFIRKDLKNKWCYHLILLSMFYLFNRSFIFFEKIIDLASKAASDIALLAKIVVQKEESGTGLVLMTRILAYNLMLPLFLTYAKKDERFRFYFRLFFFGICFLFMSSFSLNWIRMTYVWTICELFLIPYCVVRIKKTQLLKLNVKTLAFIMGCLLLIFVFLIYAIRDYKGCGFYQLDLDTRLYNIPLTGLHVYFGR